MDSKGHHVPFGIHSQHGLLDHSMEHSRMDQWTSVPKGFLMPCGCFVFVGVLLRAFWLFSLHVLFKLHLGTRHPAPPGTIWHPAPLGTRYHLAPGTRHSAPPATQHPAPGTRNPAQSRTASAMTPYTVRSLQHPLGPLHTTLWLAWEVYEDLTINSNSSFGIKHLPTSHATLKC